MINIKKLHLYTISALILIGLIFVSVLMRPAFDCAAETEILGRGTVNETVTILWREPGQQREYDHLILKDNNDPKSWVGGMNTEMRRWLVGKADSMAQYGEPVVILERKGDWVRVLAEKQRTTLNAAGYPGWVPSIHIDGE